MDATIDIEPWDTAGLIAKMQDICRTKGYSPIDTIAACVVGGITYNGRRDLSILDRIDATREELVNCASVLDDVFFLEARKMQQDSVYRQMWLDRYPRDIQPDVEPTSQASPT